MNTDLRTLEAVAAKGRLLGLDMVYHCASGHLGGSFSAMDILTVLYFDVMHVDPNNPADPNRDRFVLSKGPLHPGAVPDPGPARLFPGGGIGPVPQRSRATYPGMRRCKACEGCGYVHRLPGAGDLPRQWEWL